MTERQIEGQLVGALYRVRRLLAEGGMSDILDAEHVKTGRRVAIKVLQRDKVTHPEFVGRLERERKLLHLAKGPGVVELLDAGECPRFGPYLVMEYLHGRPLDGILVSRGKLGIAETLNFLIPLATTLARLHGMRIVHRDLKPANFFISSPSNGEERAVLLDFGVSTLFDEVQADGADLKPLSGEKLTTKGELLGTIEYMSPEQIMAVHKYVDYQSDIFSLGVSIYEILTGEMPYGVDWLQRVETMHRAAEPISLEWSVERAPLVLSKLVASMMSIERANRPANMHEVITLLEAAAESMPNSMAPAPLLKGLSAAPQESKRQHGRAAYVAPIRIISGSRVIDARSEDISEGGMLAMSKGQIPPGERVAVRFALPLDGTITQLGAVVRWCREGRGRFAIGLKFVDPPAEVTKSLGIYINLMLDPDRAPESITKLEFDAHRRS